ncbi:MAG: ChbG/HpnK family deacetylase [Bdellovibrionota bacterium]
MKVIINADDFGLSVGVNKGIIDAFKEGLISSTSILINMPDAEDAILRFKQNKGLGLGLHVNLTKGKPLLNLESLVGEAGNFKAIHKKAALKYDSESLENYDEKTQGELVQEKKLINFAPDLKDYEAHNFIKEDVYREIKAQIEKVLSYGVVIDHIDCHNALHANKAVREVTLQVCKECELKIRSEHPLLTKFFRDNGIDTVDVFSTEFSRDNATKENFIKIIEKNLKNNTKSLEIMTHVGYMDSETIKDTTYITRDRELEELRKAKASGIYSKFKLVNYEELFRGEKFF